MTSDQYLNELVNRIFPSRPLRMERVTEGVSTHVYRFQKNGRYIGIIDFGEMRSTNRWYDLGHFHMRDGEYASYSQLTKLVRGYGEIGRIWHSCQSASLKMPTPQQ
jgi:hypothetical protein